MRSLVPYFGGKARLAAHITDWIPPHTIYVELFAGGLSVFYAKPLVPVTNRNHYREVINDLDDRLINLYWVASHEESRNKLIQMIKATLFSRSSYLSSQNILKDPDSKPLQIAWATYVNLKMSYAKKWNGGWVVQKETTNNADTWKRGRLTLKVTMQRLTGIFIENDDALKVLERWDSPQTFFYADPPYPGTTQSYTSKYTWDDYHILIDRLNKAQGSFLLSGPDTNFPPEWNYYMKKTGKVATAGKPVGSNAEVCVGLDRSASMPEKLLKAVTTEECLKLFPHWRRP